MEVWVVLSKDTRTLIYLTTNSFSGLFLVKEFRNLGTRWVGGGALPVETQESAANCTCVSQNPESAFIRYWHVIGYGVNCERRVLTERSYLSLNLNRNNDVIRSCPVRGHDFCNTSHPWQAASKLNSLSMS